MMTPGFLFLKVRGFFASFLFSISLLLFVRELTASLVPPVIIPYFFGLEKRFEVFSDLIYREFVACSRNNPEFFTKNEVIFAIRSYLFTKSLYLFTEKSVDFQKANFGRVRRFSKKRISGTRLRGRATSRGRRGRNSLFPRKRGRNPRANRDFRAKISREKRNFRIEFFQKKGSRTENFRTEIVQKENFRSEISRKKRSSREAFFRRRRRNFPSRSFRRKGGSGEKNRFPRRRRDCRGTKAPKNPARNSSRGRREASTRRDWREARRLSAFFRSRSFFGRKAGLRSREPQARRDWREAERFSRGRARLFRRSACSGKRRRRQVSKEDNSFGFLLYVRL